MEVREMNTWNKYVEAVGEEFEETQSCIQRGYRGHNPLQYLYQCMIYALTVSLSTWYWVCPMPCTYVVDSLSSRGCGMTPLPQCVALYISVTYSMCIIVTEVTYMLYSIHTVPCSFPGTVHAFPAIGAEFVTNFDIFLVNRERGESIHTKIIAVSCMKVFWKITKVASWSYFWYKVNSTWKCQCSGFRPSSVNVYKTPAYSPQTLPCIFW